MFSLIRVNITFGFILLSFIVCGQSEQTRIIEGKVFESESGEVIIGASIMIANTTQSTLSDFDGEFILEIPADKNVELIVSYGYEPLRIRTRLNKSFYKIDILKFRTANRFHASGGNFNLVEKSLIGEPLLEIGLQQERHLSFIPRVNLLTGIYYRYEILTDQNEGLGALTIPLNLKRRIRRIYLQGGPSINQVIHDNYINGQGAKRYVTFNFIAGWNLTNRLDISLGADLYIVQEQKNAEANRRIGTKISVNYMIK